MLPRTLCTVVAVIAILACAHARPGVDNDVLPAQTSNEISKDVQTKNEVKETKSNDVVVTLSANKNSEDVNAAITPSPADDKKADDGNASAAVVVEAPSEEAKKEEVKENPSVSKAVNELYPHAVLFGGTCGGTIISPNWIISAGHCTLFSGGRYVLAGTNNTSGDTGVTRRVKRLIIHPRFSVGPYWLDANRFDIQQVAASWDFLLAELEEPLPLDGKTMAAVELDDGPTIPVGLEVGYGGFGAERHGETMREDMHGMELEIMPDSACQQALVQYEPEDMICTKGRPPRMDSACNGDSGSGLVANGKLYGVASWVEGDAHRCFNGALVVFSKVSAVRDWIRQVTKI